MAAVVQEQQHDDVKSTSTTDSVDQHQHHAQQAAGGRLAAGKGQDPLCETSRVRLVERVDERALNNVVSLAEEIETDFRRHIRPGECTVFVFISVVSRTGTCDLK